MGEYGNDLPLRDVSGMQADRAEISIFAVRRGYVWLARCLSLVPGDLRSEEIQVDRVAKNFAKPGFIIVSGTLQGRDVNCLIDTGASENMVDIKLEQTLMGLKQTNDSKR